MTNTEHLPAYLKEHGNFCLWKYEDRLDKSTGELKPTKVPYNPRTLGKARPNDPATFSDLATAQAAAAGFDGLGVGVFGELAGLDVDHCIHDGVLSDMAAHIVETMNTYTEVSPSGEGLRLFFRAPGYTYDKGTYYVNRRDAGADGEGLEAYIAGSTYKYMTVTGNIIIGGELEDRTEELQTILDVYMKRPQKQQQGTQAATVPVLLDDRDLIDKAMNAGNGGKFSSLWYGNVPEGKSHSEADLALCNMLAYWTGCDEARMDRLFRQSGLMRDKWEREDYSTATIAKAVADCTEVYTPQKHAEAAYSPAGEQGGEIPAITENYRHRDAVADLDAFIEDIQGDRFEPLATGMQSFDKLLGGGIMRQSLVVLSAAPGAGKTALASQVFEQFAANGNPVLFLNLEMSREYLLARSLSRMLHRTGYQMTATDVLRGYRWSEDQRAHVLDVAADYRQRIAPNLDYNPHGNTSDIKDIRDTLNICATRNINEGKPAPVVVLDYLHLLTADRMDAQETVKAGIAMLKDYAIRYNTFVLAIAANNRESNRSGSISQSSARDSSAIEYTADIQLGLNFTALEDGETKPGSADKYRADNPADMELLMKETPRRMVVRVLKHRMNAAGGKLYMQFDAAHSLFTPVERNEERYQPTIPRL